jgi:hypothetical protein
MRSRNSGIVSGYAGSRIVSVFCFIDGFPIIRNAVISVATIAEK